MTTATTITASLLAIAFLAVSPVRGDDREPLQLDHESSHIVAVTGKAGIFGFLGHEHAILATRWSATFALDRARPSRSTAEIIVPVAALEIDSMEAREKAELTSVGPGADDLPKIQAQMLGTGILDAGRHPRISFKSTTVEVREKGRLEVKGALSLHGVSREVELPVTIEPGSDETLRLAGTLRFKMSDYGIDPPSTAGVGVRDEMEIRFVFRTRPMTAVARASR